MYDYVPIFLGITFLILAFFLKRVKAKWIYSVMGIALFSYFIVFAITNYDNSRLRWACILFAIISLVLLRKAYSERNTNPR